VGGPEVEVRTVEYRDLVAVVSDAQVMTYGVAPDALIAHERVVEEAMSRTDVLPVAFGTVAPNDHELKERLLWRAHDELRHRLAYIRGRVELELKVLWNRDHLYFEIIAHRDDIRRLRDTVARRPPEAVHAERVQLGELTAAVLGDKRDHDAHAILDVLAPLAVDL